MYFIIILAFQWFLGCNNNNDPQQKPQITVIGSQQSTPASNTNQTANDKLTISGENTEKVKTALQKADVADGLEDNIAHKCAGCALYMDGMPEHALEVEGTTLHLCAAACKTRVSKDIESVLLSLL